MTMKNREGKMSLRIQMRGEVLDEVKHSLRVHLTELANKSEVTNAIASPHLNLNKVG